MSTETWWQRQTRLYGSDQSQWWARMPIDERTEMVLATIEGGAIPVFTPKGANTLHLRGAPIGEVIDHILILLDRKIPSVVSWFEWLKRSDDAEAVTSPAGIRIWLTQRGYI